MARVRLIIEVDGATVEFDHNPPRAAPTLAGHPVDEAERLVDAATADARAWLAARRRADGPPADGERWVNRG